MVIFLNPASPISGQPAVRWTEHREKGRFSYVDGALNVAPYEIKVPEKTKVWFSVHQQDTRVRSSHPYLDMGITILAADRKTLIASSGIDVDRQVQLEIESLDPGWSIFFFCSWSLIEP